MAEALWTAVRFIHIGAAIAWIGGATLWGMVVMPTLGAMGPQLPKALLPTLGGKVAKFLPHAGLLTLLTGLLVFERLRPFTSSAWQQIMLAALLITLALVVVSYAVLVPTFRRLVQAMAPDGPPTPQAMALRSRLMNVSKGLLAGGWLVVLLMVVATALRTT